MIFEGATGNKALVDAQGRVLVSASMMPRAAWVARELEDSWVWSAAGYNYAAADTVLWIRNNSATKKLYIDRITVSGDTTTQVQVHRGTATVTAAGTTLTASNLTIGAAGTADATAVQAETGNTQGTIIDSFLLLANTREVLDYAGRLALPQNSWVGVDLVTVGTLAGGSIIGWFE